MIIGLCGLAGSGKDTVADFMVKNHGFVKVAFADPLKRICRDVYDFTDDQLWGPSSSRNAPDKRYPRPVDSVAAHEEDCAKCGARHVSPLPGTIIERVGEPLWRRPCPKGGEHAPRQSNRFGQHYLTPRHALQKLGTEWGRDCYPNTWADYALRIAARLQGGDCYYDAKSGLRPLTAVQSEAGVPIYAGKTDVVISDVRFKNEVDAIRVAGGHVWKIERLSGGLEGGAGQHRSETEQQNIPRELFRFVLDNNGSLPALEELTSDLIASLFAATMR